MYKLLVVDDEYQTRKGLCELMDWQSMNISVVGDASDGDEALQLVELVHPDILLTDVRMHRMDGVELARKAREIFPEIGIIFISGYSDADYLRDALRVGACDYIYKPIHLDELQKSIAKLIGQMDRQAEMRLLLERSKPLLAERFLRSWFLGQLEDKQSIRSKLQLLGLRFPEDTGIYAAAFMPDWETFPRDGQVENCQIQLERIIRSGLENTLTCAEDTGVLALLAVPENGQSARLDTQLKAIGAEARRILNLPVIISLSSYHDDWLDAPIAVREAFQTISRQVFPAENNVLYYDQESGDQQPYFYHLDSDMLERHLLSGNIDMVHRFVDEAFSENAGHLQTSRKIALSIMLRADLALSGHGIGTLDSLTFCRQVTGFHSISSIKGALHQMLDEAGAAVREHNEQSSSPVVIKVLEIIRSGYAEHLCVNDIAEQVHYSPAHLSMLFKKETGLTLGEAILRTRIKAAMDLLRNTLESVSVIAGKVGYADVQYFSRVFKQFTGITPLEYRRKAVL